MRLALATLPFLTLGCAAPAARFTPIELLADHDFEYHGEVVGGATSFEMPVFELTQVEISDDVVEIHSCLVRLDELDARGLIAGASSLVGAWTVERDAADEFLADARREGALISSQKLSLVPGQSGSLAIVDQRAYVRSFEVQTAGHIILADPVVDVVNDGLLLEVVGDLCETAAGEPAIALDLVLRLCDVQSPMPAVETRVPGCPFPVTIQQPVVSQQSLATTVVLVPSESLVVSTLAPDGEGRVMLFVRAERWKPERPE